MGRQNRRKKNVQIQYVTIFENQILCLKTYGDWYCNCDALKFNEKFEVRLFIKRLKKDLVTTRKHSPKNWRSRRDFNKRVPV